MLAVNYSTMRDNLKSYCDSVVNNRETVIVTRKNEKNVVLMSLDEWNALQKLVRNAEYLNKLDRAIKDVEANRVITKTLDELESLNND